jgi:protein gp37
MGEKTGIQWTDKTWNPWQGCERVSPGCDHCYMFREMRRYGKDPDTVVRSSAQTFNKPLRWEREACAAMGAPGVERPAHPRGYRPPLVFLASWSDFFIREADPWRDEAWSIIQRCPSLVFQILTKRHARIAKNLPIDWTIGITADASAPGRWTPGRNGYPNVALGVTCEDQSWAERRWEALAAVPARWRFISHEPALGSLKVHTLIHQTGVRPDWIITGGESNPGARAYDFRWARQLIEEGKEYGIPIFVKQGGDVARDGLVSLRMSERHGGDPNDWPADCRVRQFPAEWAR